MGQFRRISRNCVKRSNLVLTLVLLLFASSVSAERIAILVSDDMTSTSRTVSGAMKVIKVARQEKPPEFKQFLLNEDSIVSKKTVDSIRQYDPHILLTVGSAATELAKARFPNLPVIFAGVLYPAISGFVESLQRPGGHITGASLNVSVETQFRYFRTIVPELKQIGVLYTSNTRSLIADSRPIAARMGLELVPIEITNQKELARALDSLNRVTQGIWALADPQLFNPQGTKYILLNSMRRGTPVMGFSRHLVKSGALFALDFDYKAVGRQAGKILLKVLDGVKPGSIAVTKPDVIWFHYNEKTAKRMSIAIPGDLIAVAKEVYR